MNRTWFDACKLKYVSTKLFFFFFFPPLTWKSLLFFWTHILYLSNPKGSFPQTKYRFYPVFHTLCFSHSHLQTQGDASEESCFQQPLAGSRAVGAHLAVLCSSGCRGDFSFLNTHWHLLVLGSRDQHFQNEKLLLHFRNEKLFCLEVLDMT